MSNLTHRQIRFWLFSLALLVLFIPAEIWAQNTIKVNFDKQTGKGSALMFGGNNYGFSSREISDQHKNSGFNMARCDAAMQEILPVSTIADYKANTSNIQNPETWNWSIIDKKLDMLHASGFKILLIMDYCPLWLESAEQRKLNNNNVNAVPSDWMVYDDIIKKVFTHVRNRVYAIEVWNEPDDGLKIEGTTYKNRLSAYLDLYYHTATEIRKIDSRILIGGPALATTYNTDYLKTMLADPRISKNIDFYSYHFYGVQKPGNITSLKKLAAAGGRPNLQFFITEWNFDGNFNHDPMNGNAPGAISYVGNTLINQYKEGADVSLMYCMDDYKKADNFYTMDSQGRLTPKVGVIRLMSVVLGMGTGMSKLVRTTSPDSLNAMGAINSAGTAITCIVNKGKHNVNTDIKLSGRRFSGAKTVTVYEASEFNNTIEPLYMVEVTFTNHTAYLPNMVMPANSVTGILIQ